jgi:hypothetical protein
MKKVLSILLLATTILGFTVSSAQAGETGEAIGGFAVVNPETGIVHGVITGSIEYFGGNNRTMGSEYMGCPAGCLIIQQSTADQNGNVAGVRTQQNGNEVVTYNQERNVFQVIESNTNQSEVVIESSSTNFAVETNIDVSRSVRVYEFGVQDFTNNNAVFEMTEIAPAQNTSVEISAKTTEFVCEESNLLCSSTRSNSSNILVDESVSFNERSTAVQVEAKIIVEAKNKIREQFSLILSMLEKWIIN